MFDQRLNQVAAQVAKMTPQQRQQFAMLHKNDPIIVSLTKFVNDQENAVRSGMQAAKLPEAVSQPKVVDQAIAGMAPAPQITPPPQGQQQPQTTPGGVNQLPVPNLASMPDGGIAGYADGGKVKDDEVPRRPIYGAPYGGPNLLPARTGLEGLSFGEAMRKFGDKAMSVLRTPIPGTGPRQPQLQGPTEADVQQQMIRQEPGMMTPEPMAPKPVPAAPMTPEAPVEEQDPARAALMKMLLEGGGGGGGGGGGAPAGGGIAALPQAPQPNLPGPVDVAGAVKEQMANLPTLPPEIAGRLDAVARDRAALAQDALSETERRHTEMGVAGLDREKRLKEREGKLEKAENENTGLALLSAGLAMMAGTSPNAFANIGAGAQVGLQQYAEGKQRLDAARERLDEHQFALEELRRNERNMNAKELSQAKLGIKQAALETSQAAAQAVAQMYGTNLDVATKMVDASIRQAGQHLAAQTQLYTAQLQSNTQLRTTAMENASRERAARIGSGSAGLSAKVAGLTALMKQRPENRLNDLVVKMMPSAVQMTKSDPNMKYPEDSVEFAAEVQKNLRMLIQSLPNQRGMPQSPASSAAPVDLSGWGEPKRVR